MKPEIQATLDAWCAAYARQDADALAALYTEDAVFFGGSGGLRNGREGARGYFAAMPKRTEPRMTFPEVALRDLAPGVVNVAMVGRAVATGEAERSVRFTQTHVSTPQGWRIASHHGSVA